MTIRYVRSLLYVSLLLVVLLILAGCPQPVEQVSVQLACDELEGEVLLDPVKASYEVGEQVTITVEAETGYKFSGWTGDLTGDENPRTLILQQDITATAVFTALPVTYTLTVGSADHGHVTVDGQEFSGDEFDTGSIVELTAVPDTGYEFSGWTGDTTSSAQTLSVTMDSDKQITPVFTALPATYTLTVGSADHGHVTVDDVQIIQEDYARDSTVVLTPVADAGYEPSGWTGDITSGMEELTITMDRDWSVTPTFVEKDRVAWSYVRDTTDLVSSGVAVTADDLISYSLNVFSTDSRVWVIDGTTGEYDRFHNLSEVNRSLLPMSVPKNTTSEEYLVYHTRDDENLFYWGAFSETLGIASEDFTEGQSFFTQPAFSAEHDMLILRADNGTVYANWNYHDFLYWSIDLGATGSAPVVSSDGQTAYLTSGNILYAVDLDDGTESWSFTIPATESIYEHEPVIGSDGSIYICSDDAHIYKIDSDGTMSTDGWSGGYGMDSAALAPLIGKDDTVFVAEGANGLTAISADGSLLWHEGLASVSGSVTSMLIGAGNIVYVLGHKTVFALDGTDGKLLWSHQLAEVGDPGVMLDLNMTSEGYLLVIDSTGEVSALETGQSTGLDTQAPWPIYRADAQRTGQSPMAVAP
ncbi:MAG: PQQ-binding-like beta-propeller repeat protein [Spirochaetia bacterium]|nr:PQQ-binding-like beta-propeller repeat protein [Spirochaetia bacterium]